MSQLVPLDDNLFKMISDEADFSLTPCVQTINLDDDSRYEPLPMNSEQKLHMNALMQQVPTAMATMALGGAYQLSFPEGLPHTLMALKRGGFTTTIVDEATGKFSGVASLSPMTAQAVTLGAFSAMSAVTGQYFLTQITSELKLVHDKLDNILNFLYGEKRAELIAHINFVKYAHSNYSSIIMHPEQRQATIASLQAARIVAMKDIEFYLTDLDDMTKASTKDFQDLREQQEKMLRIKDSIEMSRQLYVVSSILEMYYAQNFDEAYTDYCSAEVIANINKSDRRISNALSQLRGKLLGYKPRVPIEKIDDRGELVKALDTALLPYSNEKDSPLRISLRESLDALHRKAEYYLNQDGEVYIRKAVRASA